jgi:hypothetical protein
MKWVKLTLCEAAAVKDALKMEMAQETDEALELLQAAINNAVDEEIPKEKPKVNTNLSIFPMEGTQIANWLLEAMQISRDINITAARVWIQKNVPKQLFSVVIAEFNRRTNENKAY